MVRRASSDDVAEPIVARVAETVSIAVGERRIRIPRAVVLAVRRAVTVRVTVARVANSVVIHVGLLEVPCTQAVVDAVRHAVLVGIDIAERGARPVVLSNLPSSLALASAPIVLPDALPEWLSPIVAIMPGQLLAFHLSRLRGFDPDRPRGLQKVTRTT